MTQYIETFTDDGTAIRIEVEADAKMGGVGFARQASPDDVSSASTKDAYDQTLKTIRGCANGVIDTIQNLDALPSTASIDFAIKIDPEAGAMIAKSGADAQFKVSLSWKQPEPDKEK